MSWDSTENIVKWEQYLNIAIDQNNSMEDRINAIKEMDQIMGVEQQSYSEDDVHDLLKELSVII